MATPATAGAAALLLQAYRDRHGSLPFGSAGLSGVTAPSYALVRAALMNTAGSGQHESRWILSTDLSTDLVCSQPDPLLVEFCSLASLITGFFGNIVLYQVRNGASDPFVGPLGEGSGKIHAGRALAALRDGVVVYSAASGSGQDAGTGSRELQGSWQVGAIGSGVSQTQTFVVHAAPGVGAGVRFEYSGGRPSDGSAALPASWVRLPGGSTNVRSGRDQHVKLKISVPANAPAGMYSGAVLVRVSNGQTLQLPVFASVALHDADKASANQPSPQARIASARDVYAKANTLWPSVAGSSGTGSGADWLVYPVELGASLGEARFSVHDAAAGDESRGVTDVAANDARGPTTAAAPQVLTLGAPASGRYYVAVSRAKVGPLPGSGDFGAFVLTLDEVVR
jgi:hypothetical protein